VGRGGQLVKEPTKRRKQDRLRKGALEGAGTIRGVSLETLFKIADVLGIPPAKLLEED
jgi:acyl-CoA synthetase (NDP forming)